MLSFDAIKGLLAEQWNKDMKDTIARLHATGALDVTLTKAERPHWPSYNPSHVHAK